MEICTTKLPIGKKPTNRMRLRRLCRRKEPLATVSDLPNQQANHSRAANGPSVGRPNHSRMPESAREQGKANREEGAVMTSLFLKRRWRKLHSRAGEVEFQMPKLRKATFETLHSLSTIPDTYCLSNLPRIDRLGIGRVTKG